MAKSNKAETSQANKSAPARSGAFAQRGTSTSVPSAGLRAAAARARVAADKKRNVTTPAWIKDLARVE